jgi:hypothetical protein
LELLVTLTEKSNVPVDRMPALKASRAGSTTDYSCANAGFAMLPRHAAVSKQYYRSGGKTRITIKYRSEDRKKVCDLVDDVGAIR